MEYAIKQTFQHRADKQPLGTIDARIDVVSATLNGKPMPGATIEWLLSYGIRQGFTDSFAAGKSHSERSGLFNKRLDAAIAGSVGVRIRSVADLVTTIARDVTRDQLRKRPALWKQYTALKDTAAKAAHLDAVYAKNEIKLSPAVEAELARRASLPELDIDFDIIDEEETVEPETELIKAKPAA